MIERRWLLVALVAGVAAGCAGQLRRHPASPASLSAADYHAALAARLGLPLHQTLRFELSEPAYVTIFEIVPGRGVSIVYPAPYDDARKPLAAGANTVFAVPYDVGRWFYADLPVPPLSPTYLYMIASREPIRTGDVLHNPASLRRVVGFAAFAQSDAQRTMDALDERFVPDYLGDSEWTSDWIAIWPEDELADPQLLLRRCAEGYVLVPIPGPALSFACAPVAATRGQPAAPRDSADTTSRRDSLPRRRMRDTDAPSRDAKATRSRPRVERKDPPKQLRREPLTLVVDYGAPRGGTERLPGAASALDRRAHSGSSERSWLTEQDHHSPSGALGGWIDARRDGGGAARGREENSDRSTAARNLPPAPPPTTREASPRAEPRRDAPPPPAARGTDRPRPADRTQ